MGTSSLPPPYILRRLRRSGRAALFISLCSSLMAGVSRPAYAQGLTVPLGRATQFGLLAGGTIATDTTVADNGGLAGNRPGSLPTGTSIVPTRTVTSTAYVRGKAGAGSNLRGTVSATDSLLLNGAGSVRRALADAQIARQYCQGLTAAPLTVAALPTSLTPGAYQFIGNTTFDRPLQLTGDSTTWYVFRVIGSLIVTADAAVQFGGTLRPDHVVWYVTSSANLQANAVFPGVVLTTNRIWLSGWQFGQQTLLAGGSLSLAYLDQDIGSPAFWAPGLIQTRRLGPGQPQPPVATNCLPTLGWNQLTNGSLEISRRFPTAVSNLEPGNSDVVGWESAPGGGTPDYFHALSTNPAVRVPNNQYGSQASRVAGERAYAGFFAYARSTDLLRTEVCDYIQQALPIKAVEAGNWYYGEYWVSQAENTKSIVNQLGMFFTDREPTADWFNFRSQTLHLVPAGGTYATSPLATPQISLTAPIQLNSPLANRAGWTRVAGCFQATTNARFVLIGAFQATNPTVGGAVVPNHGNVFTDGASNRAYYYVDNFSVNAFPFAVSDITFATCGQSVNLNASCALPTSSGAEYRWTSNADTNWQPGWQSSPALTVTPIQETVYTLRIRVPRPQQPGTFWEQTSEVTVFIPNICYSSCPTVAVTTFNTTFGSTIAGQTLVLPTGRVYRMTSTTQLIGSRLTLSAGTVLALDPGVSLELSQGSTLTLNGATITGTCGQAWNKIRVRDALSVIVTNAANGRRSLISLGTNAISLEANARFTLAQTDFLNNVTSSLTDELPANTAVAAGSSLIDCVFDGQTTVRPGGGYAPHHLRLSGNFSTLTMRGNALRNAWFGLYAPGALVLGSATAPITGNAFTKNRYAGIYTWQTTGNQLFLSNNFFNTVPVDEFGQLALTLPPPPDAVQALLMLPAHVSIFTATYGPYWSSGYGPTSFGLFADNAVVTLRDNIFRPFSCNSETETGTLCDAQRPVYGSFPYGRYWQIGAYVRQGTQTGSSTISGNIFTWLHAGLYGMRTPQANVVNNFFDNCQYGVYVTANGTSPANNRVCLQCNTFRNDLLPTTPLAGGTRFRGAGIYVENGAGLRIASAASTGKEALMANQFTLTPASPFQTISPTGQPPFAGFEYAIQNNNATAIGYPTYADSPTNPLLRPQALLGNFAQGNPNLSGTPAGSYVGSVNVTPVGPGTFGLPNPNQSVAPGYDCKSINPAWQYGLQFSRTAPAGQLGTSPTGLPVNPIQTTGYVLGQNYPNPFNSETRVAYQLPAPSADARVEVCDLTGRLLRTVMLTEATGEVTIQLAGLPAGVYVYRLVCDGVVQSARRMATLATY